MKNKKITLFIIITISILFILSGCSNGGIFLELSPNPVDFSQEQTERNLELDGYNSELNIAFEYNGEQHYIKENNFNKRKQNSYKNLKSNDELKREICKERNIKLIIIPYSIKEEEIYEFIIKQLKKLNITFSEPKTIPHIDKYKNTNRITKENKFKEKVNKLGYELISNYNGYLKPVILKCKNGHEFSIAARSVDRNKGCPICRGYRKKDTSQIKEICKEQKLIFKDEKYIPGKRFKVECVYCSKNIKLRYSDLSNYKCRCQNGK